MTRRILIIEPDDDVLMMLELTVRKLGYEPVAPSELGSRPKVDAILLEPGHGLAHAVLHRFGDRIPPVICLSIFPPEARLAPPGTVAYLVKPASTDALAAALSEAFWRTSPYEQRFVA
jgi:DNA-binding response OmpR family regulator